MNEEKSVWLLTTGSGADGDEWNVESVHATEGGAMAAKIAYEQPRLRANGTSYVSEANVEQWPLLD